MGASAREAALAAIGAAVAATGADLEEITITRAGRRELVRVAVDRDGGIDLDTVAELSRAISDALDDPALAGAFAGAYVLEVTSPGVDRPLTMPRHWRRAQGRLVQATLLDGSVLEGRVVGADDDGAMVASESGEQRLAYGEVSRAVVQVEFARADETDDDGVIGVTDVTGATGAEHGDDTEDGA